jgi:hypothetical protein
MLHTFHIPVMGLAYTIDTPIRLAHLGISSVISIGDDVLIEKVRQFYGKKWGFDFQPLTSNTLDARSKRIQAYLNLVYDIVQVKWKKHLERLVTDESYLAHFFDLLPDPKAWQAKWLLMKEKVSHNALCEWMAKQFPPGDIDVNIMTKLDKANTHKGKPLPVEYNDAHASLRGFAQSKLSSSVVLSAGMNPRLFSYMEAFDDFFPDQEGHLKKKIILKVSDFRSALVQGKMLAKKGLWVSEFRIESGLNCGGHAFATQGFLLGPILEEFKNKREQFHHELYGIWAKAITETKKITGDLARPPLKFSAQGGLGTAAEHRFLLEYYKMDSVGWGSPFLLVPEAVSIDKESLRLLAEAKENDLYLSNASPLGVPFHNIKNSSRQRFQLDQAIAGKLGNPCTKKFLKLNTEFGEKPLCTASAAYIQKALTKLEISDKSAGEKRQEGKQLLEKECLCNGLAMPFLEEMDLDKKLEGKGVTLCPGPNIAYFDRTYSLREMLQHIYGRLDIVTRRDRPHMFIKEAQLYVEYLKNKLRAYSGEPKEGGFLQAFLQNLTDGIHYYRQMFGDAPNFLPLLAELQIMKAQFLETSADYNP